MKYEFWDNKWECVDVCKEFMCWYEFLKCYAKIYGFSSFDVWSCFGLYFHVVFGYKHLKLEPLIFESKKKWCFYELWHENHEQGWILGNFAHARTLFRVREFDREHSSFQSCSSRTRLEFSRTRDNLAHATHDFACARVNVFQPIYLTFLSFLTLACNMS